MNSLIKIKEYVKQVIDDATRKNKRVLHQALPLINSKIILTYIRELARETHKWRHTVTHPLRSGSNLLPVLHF